MFCSKAPIVFWCYCVKFVVACMNVTARRRLRWQAPCAIINGYTTDISRHRFKFYEPVWYYEPTAKCPEVKWKRGRFAGFADSCGDHFTYEVWPVNEKEEWTRKANGQKKQTGLMQNIVIRRKTGEKPPEGNPPDASTHALINFEASRHRGKTKRHSRAKTV